MKNKLLLSLLCATAISSTGFISEGFSAGWQIAAPKDPAIDRPTVNQVNKAINDAIIEVSSTLLPDIRDLITRVTALETSAGPSAAAAGPSKGVETFSPFGPSGLYKSNKRKNKTSLYPFQMIFRKKCLIFR